VTGPRPGAETVRASWQKRCCCCGATGAGRGVASSRMPAPGRVVGASSAATRFASTVTRGRPTGPGAQRARPGPWTVRRPSPHNGGVQYTTSTPVTAELGRQVLNLPVVSSDGEFAGTMREYLIELFRRLWDGRADLQHGMGDGDLRWRYDLYRPLQQAGLLPAWIEASGIGWRSPGKAFPEDKHRADSIIDRAIGQLGVPS